MSFATALESISLSHVAIATLILFSALYLHRLVFVYYWPLRKVPGRSQLLPRMPIRIPFRLSDATYHGGDLTVIQNKYGKNTNGMARVTAFGESGIIVSDPKHLREIFLTKTSIFVKPPLYSILEAFGPNIVTIEGGSLWKKHRILTDPCFSDAHLKFLTGITAQSFHLWNKHIQSNHAEELEKTGGIHWREVKDDIVLVTMDIIGKAGFGVDLKVLEKNSTFDQQRYKMTFANALGISSGISIPLRGLVPKILLDYLPFFKFHRDAAEETSKYIDDLIAHARSGEESNDAGIVNTGLDLLSLLVKNNDTSVSGNTEGGEPGHNDEEGLFLTDQELKSDTFIFLVAGHETSATSLQWILYELCKNPDVQDKLQKHVDEILQGRDPTYEDMDRLTYVHAVMKESLRRHPPVKVVVKTNTKRVTFEGIDIPRRSLFYINIDGLHHDPKIWKDPMRFDPERFMPENVRKVKPLHFIPFSFGQRRCSGFRFSQIEVVALLSMLVQRYHFSFPTDLTNDPKNFEIPVSHFVTQFPKGLRVMLKKRKFEQSQ